MAPLPARTPAPARRSAYTTRARPTFLYVMYAMILWAIPIGLLGAVRPEAARAMTETMTGYFAALPEPLYMLFGTSYLGYTAARQWGKVLGSDH